MSTFSVVRVPKVHEAIASQLEAKILDGFYKEGQALPSERDLMEQLGVGRPAVREAMLSLERSGLVKLSNGERARVCRPTATTVALSLSTSVKMLMTTEEGIRNLQAIRQIFEVALARKAAKDASASQLARLEAALLKNEAALGNDVEFERTDVAFHYEIALIAGNPLISGLHESLVGWLADQRTVALRQSHFDEQALSRHRAIFQAIVHRDPDRAEAAMQDHLESVVHAFWGQRHSSSP